uniref:DNA-directed RNA polymerase subunit n=1 Tax=Glossina brevipalpis TaxID=37001 RepID=A0A1A9WHW6_9MUSC
MGTKSDINMIPTELEFSVFSRDEIKQLSVVKIITGSTFDVFGHPLVGGLYDSQMGAQSEQVRRCATCFNIQACPGHLGHIELHALVYNPFFTKLVQRICNIFCKHCYKIQIQGSELELLQLQLQLIDVGCIIEALEVEEFKSKSILEDEVGKVKLEDSCSVNPRLLELRQVLSTRQSNLSNATKTTCALRSAIVHSTLQVPTSKRCVHCKQTLSKVRYLHQKLVCYMSLAEIKSKFPDTKETCGQYKMIFADEMRKRLREMYSNYAEILDLFFPILKLVKKSKTGEHCPTDVFFLDTILVTPPQARPFNILFNQIIEHPQTSAYRTIIENNSVLRVIVNHIKSETHETSEEAREVYLAAKGKTSYEKLYNAWQALQTSVDVLLDASISREAPSSAGLKQVLEKKEGLIRKHMMGKRVNFAARTVITPDPNINVDEVGIPDIFAKKLSYPAKVTHWNVAELRKMIINGPNIHPGANFIEDEKGYTTLIPADNSVKREAMAKLLFNYPEKGVKTVHRHVLNGDILLLNRQPSLHRPSIMAHKARILKEEKTFRLHYSNCKAYNADFDGDEMNAHLPQNEVARSEAYNLVNVANNYLVPKDGTPLGGLIQDHIISGVKLSIRGRFFNREDYQQLVFQGLFNLKKDIKLLPPAIIKPLQLWSGKQVLSTIIINLIPDGYERINLKSLAKINSKHWKSDRSTKALIGGETMSESEVLIRKGELLVGVLDKQQYGATPFGLVHCVFELYGGNTSTNLLTAFAKLFTSFLQREGFSLGVKDILVTNEADNLRREIVQETRSIGNEALAKALDLKEVPSLDVLTQKMEEALTKDPKFRVVLDRKYKSILDNYTNEINKTCLPNGLISKFPENNLQVMVLSGAKGSLVNTMQISCLLGQIELEGKRPPLMISGKSLPSFASFDTSPKSGGFIDGRFMTGIQPQDFFFHCMAGREGLIDTAVKTSRSGYLQRCLIKHLEGINVHYDLTVRDSDNTVIQYLYGEDGLDILKSKFVSSKFGVQFLIGNADAVLQSKDLINLKDEDSISKIQDHNKKQHSWLKKWDKRSRKQTGTQVKNLSAFTRFSAELKDQIEVPSGRATNSKTGRRLADEAVIRLWNNVDTETKEQYKRKYVRRPDPTNHLYRQDICYSAVSEKMESLFKEFIEKNSDRKEITKEIMWVKNIQSLANPGEPVGLLAAQSVGEPSTQMTLNTFHFAGRGEMNVTLGIPRLREILMMATINIKTPSMDIPIKPGQEKSAEYLRISLNKAKLVDVLQYIQVKSQLILKPERFQKYELIFQLLPHQVYSGDLCVKPKHILKFINEKFVNLLLRAIFKSTTSKTSLVDVHEDGVNGKDTKTVDADDETAGEITKNVSNAWQCGGNDVGSSDEEQPDEKDATAIKLKARKLDETEYDESDDAEEVDESVDVTENILENHMTKTHDKKQHLWAKITFQLDIKYKQLDIFSLIRDLVNKTIIHQVNNINRAIIYTGDKGEQVLKTDGINIVEMFKYNHILEVNRIYSNDIHAIAKTYGIEAAVQVIIQEVFNVFKVYGITIDRRHLSLIADYMTFDGTFQPLSRKGMEHSSSPLQQMSFESCLQFLKNATGSGWSDKLNSPSSRLLVGLPVQTGTGAFQLLTNIV